MPQTPQDILAASLTVVLVACLAGILWFIFMRPGIKAKQTAALLSQRMGLEPVSAAALDQEFCLGGVSWALGVAGAAGQWHGLRVGILLQPVRSKRVSPYTWAIVALPPGNTTSVSLQRGAPVAGATPTEFTGTMADTFRAYGPITEVQRVFKPELQAKLLAFRGRLFGVYCNNAFTWLMWEGIESDSTVFEQALGLAAEIAQSRAS